MDEKIAIEGGLHEVNKVENRALLIGVYRSSYKKAECEQNLLELGRLCDTYGLLPSEIVLVNMRLLSPATYIGKGKVKEIVQLALEQEIDIIVFDEEISPQQQRNLEKIFQKPVIDRTELILGVFAQRARTKEAKIQIDLARFRYQLPRLRHMWTHLERQKTGGSGSSGSSGGGYLKGPGEKQIEMDKRDLNRKISLLEKELDEVKKQRSVQRKARIRSHIPTFSIIGYTNAGKSTLLNALTESDVLVEDKLFSTLDTTTRKFTLPNRQQILLIDTVGFIHKIPHMLVAAFKSTLEEAVHTDILLHLIDASSPDAEKQAAATFEVLKELKAEKKPILTLLNKVDALPSRSSAMKLKLKHPKSIFISALTKEGFDDLLKRMMKEISALRTTVKYRIPQSHYALVAQIKKEGNIVSIDYEDNDILLTAEVPDHLVDKLSLFEIE